MSSQLPAAEATDKSNRSNLGVLLTGYVYKSKPRSSRWKRMFLVLTDDTLHWFKRQQGSSLFGILKGLVPLEDITEVMPLQDPEGKKLEIKAKDGRRRWIMAETADMCSLWINALDQARDAVLKKRDEADKAAGGALPDTGTKKKNKKVKPPPLRRQNTLDHLNFLDVDVSRPDVMFVSISTTDTSREVRPERVSRKGRVPWGSNCNLEIRDPEHELLTMMLSSGEVAALHAEKVVEAVLNYEAVQLPLEKGSVELTVEATESELAKLQAQRSPTPLMWRTLLKNLMGLGEANCSANTNQAYALSVLFCALAASTLLTKNFMDHFGTCIIGGLLAIRTFVQTYQLSEREDDFFGGNTPIYLQITLSAYHSSDAAANTSNLPPIPRKFIDGCFQDMVEAKRRWAITYRWRVKDSIDTVLDEQQPHFDTIKKFYPHFTCGRGKSGNHVYYEKLGFIDLDAIKATGITIDETIRHYIFCAEYMWRIVARGDKDKTISVFDMTNVKLSDLAGDVLEFLKKSSALYQNHYPECCEVMLLVNCPSWFYLLWKMVKPLVNDVTQKKIRIVNTTNTLSAMREFIDDDQIPQEYGGTAVFGDGGPENARFQNPFEVSMKEFVDNIGNNDVKRPKSLEPSTRSLGDTNFLPPNKSLPDLKPFDNESYARLQESDPSKQLFKGSSARGGSEHLSIDDMNSVTPRKDLI